MGEFTRVMNPAELAINVAWRGKYSQDIFRDKTRCKDTLSSLDQAASDLELLDKEYVVTANRARSAPLEVSFTAEPVREFSSVHFAGRFICHSVIELEELVDGQPVSALSLGFINPTLFPKLENLPMDHLLHVPVLALERPQTKATTLH